MVEKRSVKRQKARWRSGRGRWGAAISISSTLRCLRPKFFQEGDGCSKRVNELAAVL
jgi:hypothetical protein